MRLRQEARRPAHLTHGRPGRNNAVFSLSLSRFFGLIAFTACAVGLGSCASHDDTASDDNPILRKSEGDHAIHGQATAFYGHSAGR